MVLVGGADFFGLILEPQPVARTPIRVNAQTPVSALVMCIVLSDRCQCVPPKRQSYLDQRLFTVVGRGEGERPERETEAWLVRFNASSPVSRKSFVYDQLTRCITARPLPGGRGHGAARPEAKNSARLPRLSVGVEIAEELS